MKLTPLVLGFSLLAFAGAAIAQQQGMQQQGAQRAGQARVQAKALTRGTGDDLVLSGMTAQQLRSQAKNAGAQQQGR